MKLIAIAIFVVKISSAQFGTPFATNMEKSPNISVVTVATNEPGKFIPGIPLSGATDVWAGVRAHFQRQDRAIGYQVEVTYLRNGAPSTIIGYVPQRSIVLNGDGSAMPEAAEVKISKDIFDFTVTKVWITPVKAMRIAAVR